MIPGQDKPCSECRWRVRARWWLGDDMCLHPKSDRDIITGEMKPIPCRHQRAWQESTKGRRCCTSGDWFETWDEWLVREKTNVEGM